MLITIKEIIEKSGNKGAFKVVVLDNGAKLYAFKGELYPFLVAGAMLDVETQTSQDGKYQHIMKLNTPKQAPPPPPQQPPAAPVAKPTPVTPPAGGMSREASIEAQTVFRGVAEVIATGKLAIDTRLGMLWQAYGITKLSEVLPPEMVSMIDARLKEIKKESSKERNKETQ